LFLLLFLVVALEAALPSTAAERLISRQSLRPGSDYESTFAIVSSQPWRGTEAHFGGPGNVNPTLFLAGKKTPKIEPPRRQGAKKTEKL
jgi:hypothetical protein